MKADSPSSGKQRVLREECTMESADRQSMDFSRQWHAFVGVAEVERRAADGVVLIADPGSTDEQLMALDRWRADNEEHSRVFRRVFDTWCGTGPLSTRDRAVPAPGEPLERSQKPERTGSAIDAAMAWRDLIFQDLVVAKDIPGQLIDFPMVLVGIEPGVRQHHVGIDP